MNLRERISAALSRSARQVGTLDSGAVGSCAGGPGHRAGDGLATRRAYAPRVRAFEVRETCGGVTRSMVVLARCDGWR